MTTCSICRFETDLDDVAVRQGGGGCICLGCYTRETGTARPMPAALRRALEALLVAQKVA